MPISTKKGGMLQDHGIDLSTDAARFPSWVVQAAVVIQMGLFSAWNVKYMWDKEVKDRFAELMQLWGCWVLLQKEWGNVKLRPT